MCVTSAVAASIFNIKLWYFALPIVFSLTLVASHFLSRGRSFAIHIVFSVIVSHLSELNLPASGKLPFFKKLFLFENRFLPLMSHVTFFLSSLLTLKKQVYCRRTKWTLQFISSVKNWDNTLENQTNVMQPHHCFVTLKVIISSVRKRSFCFFGGEVDCLTFFWERVAKFF